MAKKVQWSGQVMGLIGALIVLVIGIALFIFIPVIGWALGPLVMLFALGMGGKRSNVWRCRSCKVAIPRG